MLRLDRPMPLWEEVGWAYVRGVGEAAWSVGHLLFAVVYFGAMASGYDRPFWAAVDLTVPALLAMGAYLAPREFRARREAEARPEEGA